MSMARRVADHSFLSLRDAPPAYVAGKVIGVKPEANGLELVSGTPASADIRPRHTRTEPGSENAVQVLITQAAFTVWRSIFTLALPQPLAIGDVLMAEAQCEIRNDASFNVEFVTGLFLSDSATVASNIDYAGDAVLLGELNGHDVDPTMHYFDTPKLGAIKLVSNFATPYLHYRVRCRSTAAVGTDYAQILAGYGHVSALVWPKP